MARMEGVALTVLLVLMENQGTLELKAVKDLLGNLATLVTLEILVHL